MAAAAAAPYVVPASALGGEGRPAPSNRIVMGFVGVGAQGTGDRQGFMQLPEVQNVAVCDGDRRHRLRAKGIHDFYVKTFHHKNYAHFKLTGDSCWCPDPEKLIEVMKAVEKPWIAFKVMAAGAIHPKSAFPWCFQNGADFILAGMFDFEIAENVKIAKQAFEDAKDRERPWRA